MIPEFGQFALALALVLASVQTLLPLVGAWRGWSGFMAVARPAAAGQFVFVAIAFACLTASFIANDFSVKYVADNSNSALPVQFRVAAVWGAHEGSLLLWALILAGWSLAVAAFSRNLPAPMRARVLGVLGLVSIGFLSFMLWTSNPFDRLIPAAIDGRDLNPLLQDFGLIIHPPMLYMGYVGFSVAYAFAVAALLGGQLDAVWARWSRPWTTVAWLFLTIGIALGSWWAYYELGWGGWWFWDPVENASFMPWLAGTALIHSLAVTEKRGAFKRWTVMLAILAFALSLLGTFLVRSGVLVSVHAFATDPERGAYILMLLGVLIGGAMALYALRAPDIRSTGGFSFWSRETLLLANNLLLSVACATVLLGTLYPLLIDALGQGKVSVGPPYFEALFRPLMLPLLILMSFGVVARWKQDSFPRLMRLLAGFCIAAIIIGIAWPLLALGTTTIWTIVGMSVAAWVMLGAVWEPFHRWRQFGSLGKALRSVPQHLWGMSVAHFGMGIFVIGVTLTMGYSEAEDAVLKPGAAQDIAGYQFRFDRIGQHEGPNYRATRGEVTILKDGETITTLYPEKRFYRVQENPMTEAGIYPGLARDLFVSLGEPLDGGAWSFRMQVKPYIRWVWLGCIFMAVGGLLAATDRRYRAARRQAAEAVAKPAPLKTAEEPA